MTCPACGAPLEQLTEHCPACHAIIAPRMEGALAPEPASVTPPARPRARQDEQGASEDHATWRSEVNERVRQRRKKRGLPAKLPLFEDETARQDLRPEGELEGPSVLSDEDVTPPERPHIESPSAEDDDPLGAITLHRDEPAEEMPGEEDAAAPPVLAREPMSLDEIEGPAPLAQLEAEAFGVDGDLVEEEEDDEAAWSLGLDDREPTVRPLERPATVAERLQAAVVDLAILATVAAGVVYFSFKAAQVGPLELVPVWPYLAGFVGFFGLLYAAYFTGISGCTPGKTAFGLRVVDTMGRAPGVWRAGARALLGAAGTVMVVGALPVFFDPARRTFPDRVFRTRVIRL